MPRKKCGKLLPVIETCFDFLNLFVSDTSMALKRDREHFRPLNHYSIAVSGFAITAYLFSTVSRCDLRPLLYAPPHLLRGQTGLSGLTSICTISPTSSASTR